MVSHTWMASIAAFDPFPFDQNGPAPPEVDVGGRQVGDALVI